MSINKDRMQLEIRLQVLEHMLAKAWSVILLSHPDPHQAAETLAANYKRSLSQETFGDDPALSDLAASEIEEAFAEFLQDVKAMLPPEGKV